MGYVNDLADACRKSGLTVREDSRWRSRNHGPFVTSRPTAIVCHHTGSSGSGAWTVVRDGRAGLAGPLAQLTLERDGSVRVLANGQAWHAGTGSWPSIGRNNANSRAVGIEAVYNGADITDAQRRAYPRLCAALCRHYGIAVGNVIGHKEWAPSRKVDPGKVDMPAFRREVQKLLSGAPAPAPTPIPVEDDLTPEQDARLRRVEQGLETVVKQLCGETATITNPWPGAAKGGGWSAFDGKRRTPVMFLQDILAAVKDPPK